MKKTSIFRTAACLCALCLLLSGAALAAPARYSVNVYINGRTLSTDVAPFLEDGTTYVPLVAFVRAMAGQPQTNWDGKTAYVNTPDLSITATPGQQWIEANGRYLYVPGLVRLVDGRTMIPVRTAAQLFGADVAWEGRTRTVTVSGGGKLLTSGSDFYDADTLYWLSRVISAESRGEPLLGQIAVGNVVLNRVASPLFPNTLYSVIFQSGQFEPVRNGTIYNQPYYLSVIAAKLCLEGASVVGDCLYFFAPSLSAGSWIVNNRTYYTTIGVHAFYL